MSTQPNWPCWDSHRISTNAQGPVYVFEPNPKNNNNADIHSWTKPARLVTGDVHPFELGVAVAVAKYWILVGATWERNENGTVVDYKPVRRHRQ
jgi:hypothetical protein